MKKSAVLVAFIAVLSFALGGVAFSAHDFSDVPDSHPFHDDISWLAASGVTEGFADGTYRPGQPVTRQAMAAFMRRLAGADPAVPRSVDAAELGGRTPADFDNAVSLDGRTPADYDDADTLQGLEPDDIKPDATQEGPTVSDVAITGTTTETATLVDMITPTQTGLHLMIFTGLADTTYDSVNLSCRKGGTVLPGLSAMNVGDNAAGHADRISFTTFHVFNISSLDPIEVARCLQTNAEGPGALNIFGHSAVLIPVR